MLLVVKFAKARVEACDDDVQKKPWGERKVTHLLLLGQGGSGKNACGSEDCRLSLRVCVALAGAGQGQHD
eukprot:2764455-Pyramimonas_sp.AAC.1